MSSQLRAVLFDLDGTLLDSVELIRRSWRHCLEEHGIDGIDDATLLGGMGRPLRAQMLEYARDEDHATEMITTYRAWNAEHHDELVDAYPGTAEAVRYLAGEGLALGVVTSKGRTAALRGLEVCGLGFLGANLVSADDVTRHKPDPTPVLAGLELVGVGAEAAVYVGDAPVDMQAGRAAGVRVAAVTWGPFERERLAREHPDYLLQVAEELRTLTESR